MLLLERALYVPAYDKSGNAVAGRDNLGIDWSEGEIWVPGRTDFGGAIPANNPAYWITDDDYHSRAPASLDVPMVYEIGTNGKIATCNFPEEVEPAFVGKYTCDLLIKRARFTMPTGRNGEPIATIGRALFSWRRLPF